MQGTTWPAGTAYNEARYIEFLFSPSVPTTATVNSAIITVEYQRSNTLTAAKLEVWDQSASQWVTVTIGTPTYQAYDQTFTVNVSSFIDNPTDANNLKFRFLAYRPTGGSTTTSYDLVNVQFDYNRLPNAPTDLLTNGVNRSDQCDHACPDTLVDFQRSGCGRSSSLQAGSSQHGLRLWYHRMRHWTTNQRFDLLCV